MLFVISGSQVEECRNIPSTIISGRFFFLLEVSRFFVCVEQCEKCSLHKSYRTFCLSLSKSFDWLIVLCVFRPVFEFIILPLYADSTCFSPCNVNIKPKHPSTVSSMWVMLPTAEPNLHYEMKLAKSNNQIAMCLWNKM